MAGKDKKPEIRFTGFTDNWEQRNLGDYIVPFSEVTTENNQYPVLTSSRKGIFLQTDYYDGHQIASADNTGYNIVPRGFFTYRHMSDDEVFKFNINNLVDFGIVSTLYPVFTTNSELDSKYLQYQLNEGVGFRKFAKLQKQGGSRTYMYLSKLKELELTMPKTVGEQKSISGLFTILDNLITLHQRKYDKLVIIKNSLLEKMLPKDGANVPEIRFAGFTDAWEQQKAVDIFMSITDKNHQELPVLSATQEHGMILRKDTGINISHDKKNEETYKRVLPGQFVIHLRSFQGGFAHSNVEGITSPAYTVMDFVEKEKHYDFFWKYVFSSKKFIKSLEKVTYGIRDGKSINFDDFSTMSFLFPSFEEQKAIGQFFKNFNHLITLHQRELDKLKNIKKSMLEKMFV
ncbi:restriction endonuclease subunit S [Schinkia azotoformans]|uniref:restriction endonuclease subunit S n=1 Tax=Schinkia azotoformans TaxID=1454 RepID=UPI002DB64C0D|nr:restriction endonuclease subunit S [Schinkia azotoformans]MEC1718452.1 restriction endonuclease subunit S [Schinkia azotoformans]MEC1759826.1 restriction endonuclease subunit S [Schinkia azotoformans]